ncbi:hypothetical protein ACFYXL_04400 [Streptomyces tsukubensis]|uniref:hypothetical protein n=1 Tax=Streptomyces tsukubensis TaxID=83656 RepID=UPI0036ADB692
MRTKWKKAATVLAASACAVTMTAGLTASTAVAEDRKPAAGRTVAERTGAAADETPVPREEQKADPPSRRLVKDGSKVSCKTLDLVRFADGDPEAFKDEKHLRKNHQALNRWLQAISSGKNAMVYISWDGPELLPQTMREIVVSYDGEKTWIQLAKGRGRAESSPGGGLKGEGCIGVSVQTTLGVPGR